MIYIRFASHRAREYGLRCVHRKAQSFYSWDRSFHPGGVFAVTEDECERMRAYSTHARFTRLRGPYDDLRECWPADLRSLPIKQGQMS